MAMWEDFIKCFKKSTKIKGCTEAKIAELFTRVPPDQRKYLQHFAKKHDEYRRRVRKYPEKMPTIDWAYYKKNVRKDMVAWVKDYEKKYDNLDSMFGDRHTMIDFSKYFGELSKQTEEVQKEVKKFKEESEERIKGLQCKMKELEAMRPYTEMTMEEFCIAHPNEAPDFRNKPTFWPHTPEEQYVEEEEHGHGHKEEESAEKKDAKGEKPDPSKPPPKASSPGTASKDGKPTAPSESKDVKKSKPKKEAADIPKAEEKEKVAAVKIDEKDSMESKITDKVTDLASKGIDFVKELGAKAIVLFRGLWEKVETKRKEVAKSAEAERSKKESAEASVKDVSVKERGSPEICNKTIIKGEDTAVADVKDHHVDLQIEGESKSDVCKKEKEKKCEDICKEKCKEEEERSKCEEEKKPKKCDVATICFQKVQEEQKSRLSAAEKESCAEAAKKSTDAVSNPCADVCKEKPKDDAKKCKPDEKASLSDTPMATQAPPTTAPFNLNVNATTTDDKTILGTHQELLNADNEIFLGAKELQKELQDFQQMKDEKSDELNKKQDGTLEIKSERDTVGKKDGNISEDSDEIAKAMFKQAIGAAQLLSEAKKKIEQAQRENSGQTEVLQHVFEKATEQINLALSQAISALNAAKKLTHRAQTTLEADEQKLVATIEKHIVLAKLLANRATAMKSEVTELLNGLKKN